VSDLDGGAGAPGEAVRGACGQRGEHGIARQRVPEPETARVPREQLQRRAALERREASAGARSSTSSAASARPPKSAAAPATFRSAGSSAANRAATASA
jgi:hypothetical protein